MPKGLDCRRNCVQPSEIYKIALFIDVSTQTLPQEPQNRLLQGERLIRRCVSLPINRSPHHLLHLIITDGPANFKKPIWNSNKYYHYKAPADLKPNLITAKINFIFLFKSLKLLTLLIHIINLTAFSKILPLENLDIVK